MMWRTGVLFPDTKDLGVQNAGGTPETPANRMNGPHRMEIHL